jgi:ubiquinone/menaquinone biosynthesis C-methylase UbiE
MEHVMKHLAKQLTPPLLWKVLSKVKRRSSKLIVQRFADNPTQQDLGLYWDKEFADILDTWGEGNTWHEIVLLLASSHGKILDIACGTGKTIQIVNRLPDVDVYGCDISDYLIQRAIELGIPKDKLTVCDATKTPYQDNEFDYSYSIGSLEHFTEEGIEAFVKECHRITRYRTYHTMPFSRSGKDEGWIKTRQSYFNNSTDWWMTKFKGVYSKVYMVDSLWNDKISIGKWIIAEK